MTKWIKGKVEFLVIKTAIIAISWYCLACGGDRISGSEVKSLPNYYLVKVDSIRIYRETDIRILDLNTANGGFLAVDKVTEEFLVLDERGKVLETIFRRGEGPNEYNSRLLTASFNQEEGGYFAQSSVEFLWFNDAWEINKRIRFASSTSMFFYPGPKLKVPYYRLSDASIPYFFTNFFSGFTYMGGSEGEMAKYLIEQFNPQKQDLDWVLPSDSELLPEFEVDQKNKGTKPTPIYALNREEKLLYLTFERSTEIGVYDMANEFEVKKKISFTHESFSLTKKSKNTKLVQFSPDLYGILYFEGLSEAATEARKSAEPNYFPFMDPSLYQMIVIHDGVPQVEEIDFPLSCDPRSEILQLPGNRLLLRDKYTGEVEPEYHAYSIYELKAE